MAKTVGSFEGKTHFSALIAEAERGETIVVTKKGRPVAQIGPVHEPPKADDGPAEAVVRILARSVRAGVPTRTLIDEGRRL